MKKTLESEALKEEGRPEWWWWLSFADPSKPKGTQFLGALVIKAPGMATALLRAHRNGTNPGGAVEGFPVQTDEAIALKVLEEVSGKLMSKAECDAFDARLEALRAEANGR